VICLATPSPIVGVALKLAYLRVRWLVETPGLLMMSHAARVLPYALGLLWPVVWSVPRGWFELAAVQGLGPARQLWSVALPSTWPMVLATWTLTTALAIGELPSAYFVAAPGYQPLSMVLWGQLHMGVESRLAGMALWMLVLAGALGALAHSLQLRWLPSMGASRDEGSNGR
jgi:sulfate transport system permease protein